MDAVNKSHNFSAIMRTADAVGIQRLHAVSTGDTLRRHHMISGGTKHWVERHAASLDRRPRSRRCAPRDGGSWRRTRREDARLSRRGLHGEGRDHGRRGARRLERRGHRGGRRPHRDPDARARHVAERLGGSRRDPARGRATAHARPGFTSARGSRPRSASARCSSGRIPTSPSAAVQHGRPYPPLTADGTMASNPCSTCRSSTRCDYSAADYSSRAAFVESDAFEMLGNGRLAG